MGFEPLRVIAEGRVTIVDSRVHVGGVALSELIDNLPCRYVSPAHFDYGEARITVELIAPVLAPEEVTAA
jgi:hypothetical protein